MATKKADGAQSPDETQAIEYTRLNAAPVDGPMPANGDLGAGEVQALMDEEQEQGFRGVEVDPTPNENYTVAGVTSGAPTPETDAAAAEEARRAAGFGSPLRQHDGTVRGASANEESAK